MTRNGKSYVLTLLLLGSFLTGCNRGDDPTPQDTPPAADPIPKAVEAFPAPNQAWGSPSTAMAFVWIDDMKMWVGKHEVTNSEYRRKIPDHDSGRFRDQALNGDLQPVVRVNLQDAKAYAAWLTEQDKDTLPEGHSYRLPTESEWVTFARCGNDYDYPWGATWPPVSGQAGNYRDETAASILALETERFDYNDGHAVAAPVDQTWANDWGLHGVGGNIWEACLAEDDSETLGSWRGGSWYNHDPRLLNIAYRYLNENGQRLDIIGFRLVLAPTAP